LQLLGASLSDCCGHNEYRLTLGRVAAIDDAHVVGVNVDTSTSVDVAEPDSEVSTARPSVAQVTVERSFDGTVRSRRTWCAELLRLTSVDLTGDADQLTAAVQGDVATVATILYPLCSSTSTIFLARRSLSA